MGGLRTKEMSFIHRDVSALVHHGPSLTKPERDLKSQRFSAYDPLTMHKPGGPNGNRVNQHVNGSAYTKTRPCKLKIEIRDKGKHVSVTDERGPSPDIVSFLSLSRTMAKSEGKIQAM